MPRVSWKCSAIRVERHARGDRVDDARHLAGMRDPDRVADGDLVRAHLDQRRGDARDGGRIDGALERAAERGGDVARGPAGPRSRARSHTAR